MTRRRSFLVWTLTGIAILWLIGLVVGMFVSNSQHAAQSDEQRLPGNTSAQHALQTDPTLKTSPQQPSARDGDPTQVTPEERLTISKQLGPFSNSRT